MDAEREMKLVKEWIEEHMCGPGWRSARMVEIADQFSAAEAERARTGEIPYKDTISTETVTLVTADAREIYLALADLAKQHKLPVHSAVLASLDDAVRRSNIPRPPKPSSPVSPAEAERTGEIVSFPVCTADEPCDKCKPIPTPSEVEAEALALWKVSVLARGGDPQAGPTARETEWWTPLAVHVLAGRRAAVEEAIKETNASIRELCLARLRQDNAHADELARAMEEHAKAIAFETQTVNMLQDGIKKLKAELSALEAQHEVEAGKLIDERDEAEESLSQAYFLVVGQSPEWSNRFGHKEAIQEIDDAQRSLRQTIAQHAADILASKREALVEACKAACVACNGAAYEECVDSTYWDFVNEFDTLRRFEANCHAGCIPIRKLISQLAAIAEAKHEG